MRCDSRRPAQVIAIHIVHPERWQGVVFDPDRGKWIRTARSGELNSGEKVRISVSLAAEQPLGVGDVLHTEDGADAIVCHILGGRSLTQMVGCSAEPDLLVAPDHPWARLLSADSGLGYLRVGVRSDKLLGQVAISRSTGPYTIVRNAPLRAGSDQAQMLYAEDLDWLLACSAIDLAFELYGSHCDCSQWRVLMHEKLYAGEFCLADLVPPVSSYPQNLADSLSGTVSHLVFLLRGLGIETAIVQEPQPSLHFRLMTEADRLALSGGEVSRSESRDRQDGLDIPGGLFCQRIFGPEKDWQCRCGKYRGSRYEGVICDQCGVEITRSTIHARYAWVTSPHPCV